jgi:hypothetical protein
MPTTDTDLSAMDATAQAELVRDGHVSSGELVDADIEINAKDRVLSLTRPAPHGSFDLESVVTHEAGHFFGLDHSALIRSRRGQRHATGYRWHEAHGINGGNPKLAFVGATNTMNFRLLHDSPLIDAGTNVNNVTEAIDGMVRPLGARTDIGPYEFDTNLLVHFDFTGPVTGKVPDVTGHGHDAWRSHRGRGPWQDDWNRPEPGQPVSDRFSQGEYRPP